MTYDEATAWIVSEHNSGARVRCYAVNGRVWLTTSTGNQKLVLHSDDRHAVNTMHQALQQYIDTMTKRTVSA